MSDDNFQDEFDYNDRYGIRPARAWVPYAIVIALVGGIWLTWAGLHHAQPTISYQLLSFNNQDPRNIEIRYIVTRDDPSMSATCILASRDFDKVIVGQITDHIDAGTEASIERTIRIASRADAVNAGITTCYLD